MIYFQFFAEGLTLKFILCFTKSSVHLTAMKRNRYNAFSSALIKDFVFNKISYIQFSSWNGRVLKQQKNK